MTANVGVYDGLGLGALVKAARPTSATSDKPSTVTNVIMKPKGNWHPEPQAGINTPCVPSMAQLLSSREIS